MRRNLISLIIIATTFAAFGCGAVSSNHASLRTLTPALSTGVEGGGTRLGYVKGQAPLKPREQGYSEGVDAREVSVARLESSPKSTQEVGVVTQAPVSDSSNRQTHQVPQVVVVKAGETQEKANNSGEAQQPSRSVVTTKDGSQIAVQTRVSREANKETGDAKNNAVVVKRLPPTQAASTHPKPQTAIRDASTCEDVRFCYDAETATRYVKATFAANKITLDGRYPIDLFNKCKSANALFYDERPAGGDIVFFHNTERSNDGGSDDNWFSHVAIVTDVDSEGTATFVGYQPGGLREGKVNPKVETKDPWRTPNSQLRAATGGSPVPGDFADHLFAGYCNLAGDAQYFDLIDAWTPTP